MKKVISTIEFVPTEIDSLPDGNYSGEWSGYIIKIEHDKKYYQLETEEGIRSLGVKVNVNVKDGITTFSL